MQEQGLNLAYASFLPLLQIHHKHTFLYLMHKGCVSAILQYAHYMIRYVSRGVRSIYLRTHDSSPYLNQGYLLQ
jgi:hypothetical protein